MPLPLPARSWLPLPPVRTTPPGCKPALPPWPRQWRERHPVRPAPRPALLQGKLPAGVALAADDTITLGGLRAANPATGLAADDTLEARLDAQHDWFLQNAGLEITI